MSNACFLFSAPAAMDDRSQAVESPRPSSPCCSVSSAVSSSSSEESLVGPFNRQVHIYRISASLDTWERVERLDEIVSIIVACFAKTLRCAFLPGDLYYHSLVDLSVVDDEVVWILAICGKHYFNNRPPRNVEARLKDLLVNAALDWCQARGESITENMVCFNVRRLPPCCPEDE